MNFFEDKNRGFNASSKLRGSLKGRKYVTNIVYGTVKMKIHIMVGPNVDKLRKESSIFYY